MKVKKKDKPRNDPKLEPKKYLRKMLNRFWQIQLATKKENFHCYHDWRASGVGLDGLLLMIWVVMYESSKARKSRMGVFAKCEDPKFRDFLGNEKSTVRMGVPGFETSYQMLTFVYWIGFIRARVIIFSVSTSPDDGTHGREGDDLGIPMIHNEVRKIRRWRSVIADWFSSNFEIWFIAAWICGESHVRCSTGLNPFFEALTLPGVSFRKFILV